MFGDGATISNIFGDICLLLLIGGLFLSLCGKLSSFGGAMGPGRKTVGFVAMLYLGGVAIFTALLSFYFWAPIFGATDRFMQEPAKPSPSVTKTVTPTKPSTSLSTSTTSQEVKK